MLVRQIRNGRQEEGLPAARLIREAGDRLMDVLTAADDPEDTVAVLSALWSRRGNRFSWEHARILETETRPAGLALGYLHDEMARLDSGTLRDLMALRAVRMVLTMLRRPLLAWGLLSSRESEPGDWYLCVLAADPGFRGQGIGTTLLEDAESRARACGACALSLTVAADNPGARRLYHRFGFRDRGELRVGSFLSLRMAKEI